MSPISLRGGPRLCEGRDVHQVVGDDTEPDPAVHAVFPMVTTAVESMSAFQHTDATFTTGPPALGLTEPATLMRLLFLVPDDLPIFGGLCIFGRLCTCALILMHKPVKIS